MARPEARPPPRPGCGLSRVRVRPRTRRRLGGVNARAARPPARTSLPRARGPGRLVPAPFPWWPPQPDPHRDAPSGRERCLELSRAAQRPACLSHSNRTFYSVASMGLGSSHPRATSRSGEPALRQDTAAAARTQRRRGAGRGARGTRLRAAGPLRIFRATRRPHGRRIVFCVAWFVHLLLSSEPGLFSGPDGPPGQDPEPTGPHGWRGRRARLGVWESPEQPDVGRCCPPENVSATSSAPGRS